MNLRIIITIKGNDITVDLMTPKVKKPEASTITMNDLLFDFTTKQELLIEAFELYGDILTDDEILDRCNRIWEKYLKIKKGNNNE